jgi:hypothetical protein
MKEFQGTNGKTSPVQSEMAVRHGIAQSKLKKLLNSDVNPMSDNSSPYRSIRPFQGAIYTQAVQELNKAVDRADGLLLG